MILMDKYGQSTERAIRNRTFEGDNQGDKSLVIFDSPGDVCGTVFSHTKKADSDDQWLHLPAQNVLNVSPPRIRQVLLWAVVFI